MTNNLNDHRPYKALTQNWRFPSMSLKGASTFMVNILSYGINLPIIRYFIRRRFNVVCVVLSRLRKKGDYAGLYSLLIYTLSGSYFRKKNRYQWGYLMRFGVAITQERQINWLVRDLVLEDNLILLGSLAATAPTGYDAAYAFVGYSLWLFERGDIHGALNMIQMAVQADDSWGYPEYLHGWYGLFTSGVDSVDHFARAVQIDWSFLHRMKQDKTCRQYPELLKEVQKRTLVAK
jgi:hypothetical protein